MQKFHYFECQCYSDEHTLKFTLDDEDEPYLVTSIFLNQYRSIFKRVWVAIKYIFGYTCKYGHWDCWELRPEDSKRLMALLEEHIIIATNQSFNRNCSADASQSG